jgi:DNA-binding beta-propeller fold protein YncE
MLVTLAAADPTLAGPRLYVSETWIGGGALGNRVNVIDTTTNERVGDPILTTNPGPLAPVVSPDGKRVYVQSIYGPIDVIDTATQRVMKTFENPNPQTSKQAASLTASPDGTRLFAVAADEPSIAMIDATSGLVVSRITPDGPPIKSTLLRTSHDNSRLFVMDAVDLSVTAIDLFHQSQRTLRLPPSDSQDQLAGFAVSADDRSLYAVTYSGDLVQIDADSMTVKSSDRIGSYLYGIALAPDGSHAFVAQGNGPCMLDVDLGAVSVSASGISDTDFCVSVAASRTGALAYAASSNAREETYSVVALDQNGRKASIDGFSYASFDDQSIDASASHITPRAGLWWVPGAPGSSLQIEVQDGVLVLVLATYDSNGSPAWRLASAPFDSEAGAFEGHFVEYEGGSCLGCAYRPPTTSATDVNAVSLALSSASSGTLTYGGQTVPIEKYTW